MERDKIIEKMLDAFYVAGIGSPTTFPYSESMRFHMGRVLRVAEIGITGELDALREAAQKVLDFWGVHATYMEGLRDVLAAPREQPEAQTQDACERCEGGYSEHPKPSCEGYFSEPTYTREQIERAVKVQWPIMHDYVLSKLMPLFDAERQKESEVSRG